jgi:hypothetical protein
MSDIPQRLAAALAGRYVVEREIGAGGMATVYGSGPSGSGDRGTGRVARSD